MLNTFWELTFETAYKLDWQHTNGINYNLRNDSWSEFNSQKQALLIIGDALSFISRQVFEATLKSGWMTDIGNYEMVSVEKPDEFQKLFAGLKYIEYMSRDFDATNPVQALYSDFKISKMPVGMNLQVWKNVMVSSSGSEGSNEQTSPMDIFKPIYTRLSPSCLKMDLKKIIQTGAGQSNGFQTLFIPGRLDLGLKNALPELTRRPRVKLWLDYPSKDKTGANLKTIPQTHDAAIGLGRSQALSIALKNKQHRRLLKPKGTCENKENTQFTVKECTSMCFVKKMVESKECGCIPAWGMEFCDILGLEKRCNFDRDNAEGSFFFSGKNFTDAVDDDHDDHRKKREAIELEEHYDEVRECSFSDFVSPSCFNFIDDLKRNLNDNCANCPIPCNKTEISTKISSSNSGIHGTLADLSFSKDYKTIKSELKENSAEEWGEVLHHNFNELPKNLTEYQKHTLSTSDYLEKLLRGYCFRRGKDFDTEGTSFDAVLSSAMIQVNIFFEAMEVEFLNEELADQWSSLISDMGGQLGLWVGVSLTSAVEIIFFFVWLCKNKFCGKSSAGRVKPE